MSAVKDTLAPKVTPAMKRHLVSIAAGKLKARNTRFGPFSGILGITYSMVRKLSDADLIGWKELPPDQDTRILRDVFGPLFVAILTDAGRAAINNAAGGAA